MWGCVFSHADSEFTATLTVSWTATGPTSVENTKIGIRLRLLNGALYNPNY
jgi:hypothetical protein